MVDERMKEVLNKIRSEMLTIIYYIVVISFVSKILLLGMDFKNIITEFVILIFVPFYQAIRASQLKLNMADFYPGKKKYAISTTIALAFTAAIYVIVMVSNHYTSSRAIISLLSFIAAFIAARILFLHFYKKQKDKNEKEFDD